MELRTENQAWDTVTYRISRSFSVADDRFPDHPCSRVEYPYPVFYSPAVFKSERVIGLAAAVSVIVYEFGSR